MYLIKSISPLIVLISTFFNSGLTQEKTKKEVKEEKKIDQQKQTEALVNSKQFTFVAATVITTGIFLSLANL